MAEAFAQALRRGPAIRDLARWVSRAAFPIAAGELKRRGSIVGPVPERQCEEVDRSPLLSALEALSRKQRGSLVLFYYGGYPTREIARMLGSTPAAVRIHLMRGRRRLRELLDPSDHGARR